MMYKSKHFELYELVDKYTYNTVPHWKLWGALDSRLLKVIDILREDSVVGVPITINSWKWNGKRQWSGLRVPESPYYLQYSQHSFGRAVDMIFKGIPAEKVRERIKELMNQGAFKGVCDSITCEETKDYRDHGINPLTWCHLDLRVNNPGYNEFYV